MNNNIYIKEYEIRGTEIDCNYFLRHENIMGYYENSFAHVCADLKLAAYDLYPQNKTWIITDLYIDFIAPLPHWRETVVTHNWGLPITGLRILRHFTAQHNNTIFARAIGSWLVIDKTSLRPSTLDNTSNFEYNTQEAIANFSFQKISAIDIFDSTYTFKIGWNDIDFNNHLNSIHYFRHCIESIKHQMISKKTLQSVQMKFIQQAYIDDTITVRVKRDNDKYYHSLLKDDKEIFRMLSVWT